MKKLILILLALGFLNACGPKNKEKLAKESFRVAYFKNIQFNIKGYLTAGFNPLEMDVVKKTDCFKLTYDAQNRIVAAEFMIKNQLEDAYQYGFAKRVFNYTDSSFYYSNYDRNLKKLPFGRSSGAETVFAKEVMLKNNAPTMESGLDFNNKPLKSGFIKLFECDSQGRIIWERHEDIFGKSLDFTANEGVFYRKYAYTKNSLVSENSFWETKQKPKSIGVMHKIVYAYNEAGNMIKNEFKDQNERLIKEPSTGIAFRVMQYNTFGNMLEQVLYDERNEVVKGMGGYAYQINTFDQFSNNTSRKYLDANKNAVIDKKTGAFAERITYDNRGDLVLSEFLNNKGEIMTANVLKYAYKAFEYDTKGRVISEAYYDHKNKAIVFEGLGAHAKLSEYNGKGMLVASSFLNTNGALFLHPACNCSRMEFMHDSLGNITKEKYLKPNGGSAASGPKKIAQRSYTYDEFGFMQMVQYYDSSGKEITVEGNRYLQ